jgi:acetyltransferase
MGPNCLGLINASQKLNASFAQKEIPAGSVGLIMQSGAMVTAFLDSSLGFSLIATLGNKLQVSENELLEYYAKDKNTQVIALYLESIADGQRFAQALRKVTPKKPVVILKAGNSQEAQSAIQSHTGAMAGSVEIAQEAIEEAGGIFCHSMWEFVSTVKFLANFKLPRSNQVALVTNAGGPGVVTTDLIGVEKFLELAKFTRSQQEKLKKDLPEEAAVGNPIDLLGDAQADRYKAALVRLKKMRQVGAALALVTPQAQTPVEKIVKEVNKANQLSSFPVLPVIIGEEAREKAQKQLAGDNLELFNFPLEAVKALANGWQFQLNKSRAKAYKPASNRVIQRRAMQAEAIVDSVFQEERKVFYYGESQKLAALYNLAMEEAYYLETLEDVERGVFELPVVLKVDSPEVLHKNTKAGVVLGIDSKAELKRQLRTFRRNFRGGKDRFLAQTQINPGAEFIIGIKEDSNFGKVLMVGAGGILTEILNEKIFCLVPASRKEIKAKIENSLLGKILKKQHLSADQLAQEAEKVSQLALENPDIKELDINPIMLYPDDKPKIVDLKVLLK